MKSKALLPIFFVTVAVLAVIRFVFGGGDTVLGSVIKIGFTVIMILIIIALIAIIIRLTAAYRRKRDDADGDEKEESGKDEKKDGTIR